MCFTLLVQWLCLLSYDTVVLLLCLISECGFWYFWLLISTCIFGPALQCIFLLVQVNGMGYSACMLWKKKKKTGCWKEKKRMLNKEKKGCIFSMYFVGKQTELYKSVKFGRLKK